MSDRGTHTTLPVPPRRTSTNYPGVYRSVSGSYEISYEDSAGRRIFETLPKGTKLKEAVQYRADILGRMNKGGKVIRSRMTVKELVDEYLRTQTAHLKPKTYESYSYALDHWVVPRLGNVKLSELSVAHIADFIVDMRKPRGEKPGFKKWTISNCLTPMNNMFRYASRRGWMHGNPVRELHHSERPKTDQSRMEILSADEIASVLKHGLTYELLFTTAIFTGLRKGELLALDWKDIDYDNAIVKVRSGKTAAAQREVVIPDFLVRALAKEDKLEGSVFPFQKDNVNRALTACLQRAGVKHVRFHDLRHTYASMLISKGVPVTRVSRLMGHSNPAITLKVYAQLWEEAGETDIVRDLLQEVMQ